MVKVSLFDVCTGSDSGTGCGGLFGWFGRLPSIRRMSINKCFGYFGNSKRERGEAQSLFFGGGGGGGWRAVSVVNFD